MGKKLGAMDRAEVRADYEQGMRNGILRMDSLGIEIDRFFISDEAIAWDGIQVGRLPGAVLAAAGVPFPDGGTAEDDYVQANQVAVIISFRDGLMVGEDFYVDGEGSIRKLDTC